MSHSSIATRGTCRTHRRDKLSEYSLIACQSTISTAAQVLYVCSSAGFTDPAAVIAQALQATAALASVAQNGTHDGSVRHDIKDNAHDVAVVQSIAQATRDANISSAVLASALTNAINLALTQGGQLPASYDPEVAAILIAAAHVLQQDKAITTGFSQVIYSSG